MSKWRIYREVDLTEESSGVERLHVLSTVSSRAAHEISVLVKCGKQHLSLDGVKAFLSVILPDHSSFTEDGEINGSQAVVVLPEICYRQEGEVKGVLHLTMSDASTVPIYGFILLNNADMTDVLADKYNVIPSVSQLLAEIQTLRDATKEATTAAENANDAAGRSPYVGSAGTWFVWDADRKQYVDTNVKATGPQGPQGVQGPQGIQGPQGEPGKDGNSFVISGLYATLDALHAAHPTGSEGEAYGVGTSESNVVYIWDVDAEAWANMGALQGPAGPQGPQGSQGPQGEQGIQGPQGAEGYSPQRGTDYWTADDRAQIVSDVLSALPNASGVSF